MNTRPFLTAVDVKTMLAAAEAEAQRNQWAVSIAISDEGGHMLGMTRLDGASPMTSYMCQEKARSAAMGKRESKAFEDMINGGRVAFLSAPLLQGMLEGGVPIFVDGHCLGAIGVSGVKSSEDAQVARAGIAALTLA
ncbi:MAG: heme-binding protein [Burkholderiaceae bacterium]